MMYGQEMNAWKGLELDKSWIGRERRALCQAGRSVAQCAPPGPGRPRPSAMSALRSVRSDRTSLKLRLLLAALIVFCLHISFAQSICYSRALLNQQRPHDPVQAPGGPSEATGDSHDLGAQRRRTTNMTRSAAALASTGSRSSSSSSSSSSSTTINADCEQDGTQKIIANLKAFEKRVKSNLTTSTQFSRPQTIPTTAGGSAGKNNKSFSETNPTTTQTSLKVNRRQSRDTNTTEAEGEAAAAPITATTTTTTTTTTTSTGSSDASEPATNGPELTLNDLYSFRLEYNKYKIISHLRFPSDPSLMEPTIDVDLRNKLAASSALRDSASEAGSLTSVSEAPLISQLAPLIVGSNPP